MFIARDTVTYGVSGKCLNPSDLSCDSAIEVDPDHRSRGMTVRNWLTKPPCVSKHPGMRTSVIIPSTSGYAVTPDVVAEIPNCKRTKDVDQLADTYNHA